MLFDFASSISFVAKVLLSSQKDDTYSFDLHLSAVIAQAGKAKLMDNTDKKGAAKTAAPFINYEEENLFY